MIHTFRKEPWASSSLPARAAQSRSPSPPPLAIMPQLVSPRSQDNVNDSNVMITNGDGNIEINMIVYW